MPTTIAQTILTQLGGNRFLAMTGATQLCNLGDGLSIAVARCNYLAARRPDTHL